MKGVGTNEAVDELIAEYHSVLPPMITMNETDMLLASLLMELQAQRISQGTGESVDVIIEENRREYSSEGATGTYRSESLEVGSDDWREIDLDFTTSEIDLRNITGPVEIAFADRSNVSNRIEYDTGDSPVAGIRIATSNIWVRAATDGATEQLDLEAWT